MRDWNSGMIDGWALTVLGSINPCPLPPPLIPTQFHLLQLENPEVMLQVGSEKLPNPPKWEGCCCMKLPSRAYLYSETRGQRWKATFWSEVKENTSSSSGLDRRQERLILLKQAAWEATCNCASKDRTQSVLPHQLSRALAVTKVPRTSQAAVSTQQELFL